MKNGGAARGGGEAGQNQWKMMHGGKMCTTASGGIVVIVFEGRHIGMSCCKSAQDFRAGPRVKTVDIPGEAHTKGVRIGWEIVSIEKGTLMDTCNPTAPWMDAIYVKDKSASEVAALVRIASRPIRLTFKTDCAEERNVVGAPNANISPSTYSAHGRSESGVVATDDNDNAQHKIQAIDPGRSQETRTDTVLRGQQLLKRKPAPMMVAPPRGDDNPQVRKSSRANKGSKYIATLKTAGPARVVSTARPYLEHGLPVDVRKRRTHRFRKSKYRHKQEQARVCEHGEQNAGTSSDLPLNAQTPPAVEESRRLDLNETETTQVRITCGRCHSAFHLASASHGQQRHQNTSLHGNQPGDFKHWLCPMCTASLLKTQKHTTQTTDDRRVTQHEPGALFRQHVGAIYPGLSVRSHEQNKVQSLLSKIKSLQTCVRQHHEMPMSDDFLATTFEASIRLLKDEMCSLTHVAPDASHFQTVIDLLGVYFSSLGDVVTKAYSLLNVTDDNDTHANTAAAAENDDAVRGGGDMTTRNANSVNFHLSNFVHSLMDVFLKGSGIILGMVPNASSIFLAAEKQSTAMRAAFAQHRRTKYANNDDDGGVLFHASRDFHNELEGECEHDEKEYIENMAWEDIRNLIPDDEDGHTTFTRVNFGSRRITSTVATAPSVEKSEDFRPYWYGLRERTLAIADSQGRDANYICGIHGSGRTFLPQQQSRHCSVSATGKPHGAECVNGKPKGLDFSDAQCKSLKANVAFVNRVSFEQSRIVRTILCRLAKTDTSDVFSTTIIFQNCINAMERLQDRLETMHDFLDVKVLADLESSAWLLQIYELCSLALCNTIRDPRTSASARLRIETLFRQHMKLYRRVSTKLHSETYTLGVLAILQRTTAHILYAQS